MKLATTHPDWALGFQDETWWSRFAQPQVHAWSPDGQPLRLVEQTKSQEDTDPKALACYGLLVSWRLPGSDQSTESVWLRFVDGRPVSSITTQFLRWCCEKLAVEGKKALLMVWDNASWHISREVRMWLREHNRVVKQTGQGVRIVSCLLPTKSPWLNPIEPVWVHTKRHVVEPNGTLSVQELADRICADRGCFHEAHLAIPENVAG
ncbi:MAG: transposase [Anaerolineae bacterium]|nr:transposase [Anaerolineae bacterium]